MKKERLDVLMMRRGLAASRERAKACIMAGEVFVGGQRIDKAGAMIKDDAEIIHKGKALEYVSRGGLKLAKAIEVFDISLEGKVMADIGASTGGFTDCALKGGAELIYAIDVGYGQLAWSLRTDPKVINMERTNICHLDVDNIDLKPDFIALDVSFISLEKVLPVAYRLLKPEGEAVALIKPQFEAGRDKVGKKGVVKEASVHYEVAVKITEAALNIGFCPAAITFSPVKGPEGNIEYLLYLNLEKTREPLSREQVKTAVIEAHAALNR